MHATEITLALLHLYSEAWPVDPPCFAVRIHEDSFLSNSDIPLIVSLFELVICKAQR